MIKKYVIFSIILLTNLFTVFSVVLGEGEKKIDLGKSKPNDILEGLKTEVQNTALDKAGGEGIKGSLSSVKDKSSGYIQWIGFIGLTIALILIIYNGMYLLGNFGSEDKLGKVKKRFLSLIIGVLVLTSGYVIIKLVTGLVGGIFN